MALGVLISLLLLLLAGGVDRADAANFNWFGEGGSTCWQTGRPWAPSTGCDSVGAKYLSLLGGGRPGGLERMVNVSAGGIGVSVNLTPAQDYCAYYKLGDELTSSIATSEGPQTGFTTPTPFSDYQEGDGHGNTCQAYGSQWGLVSRKTVTGNTCASTGLSCGIQHYVSFRGGGIDDRPWSSSFGSPSLIVSAESDPQIFTTEAKGGGWGYVCPELEESATKTILEYCLQEWRGANDEKPTWEDEWAGECKSVGEHNLDLIHTFFWPGTAYETEREKSANAYVWSTFGGHHFEAAITPANLLNAVAADQSACAGSRHETLSTDPASWALIGVEQGHEGWSGAVEIGESTANLQLRTEYTPLAPSATTEPASEVQHHQATLNGAVAPGSADAHYYFQYGETTSYEASTPVVDAGAGGAVSATASELNAGTTYHYRVVAYNSVGESVGADHTFTTPAPAWTLQSAAIPQSTMHTSGVSCTSKTACTAVGSYADQSGATHTLVERWNGSAWTVQSSPNVEGTPSNQLTGVSCASASSCFASANYTTTGGSTGSYTESWNGTTWSSQSIATPSEGASASWLSGVSCTSASACTIAGSYTNLSGTVKTLVERWNGSAWTVQSSPNVEGTPSNQLTGVSCASASSCFASANYTTTGGSTGSYTESWNGTTWSSQSIATPSEGASASWLSGVSCTSASACTIAGSYTNLSGTVKTLVERWNGSAWTVQSSPNVEGTPSNQLTGVSCASASSCFASANYTTTGGSTGSYTESWNGTTWSSETLAGVSGVSWLTGISCASASACNVAGTYTNGSGAFLLAEGKSGGSWSVQPTPTARASLHAISCTSPSSCSAVGSYTGGAGIPLTLAERWNGAEWSVQSSAAPAGPSEWSASSVSCVGASFCMASDNDLTSGLHRIYAELWTGSSWAAVGMPLPSGATEASLNGISCTATSACTAVGSYKSSSGTIFALAERWNGLEWAVQSTANPAGPSEWSASSVSCVGASFCMASHNDLTSGLHRIYAELWTGSSWAAVGMPLPSGATEASLNGISCTATSACTAVGSYKSGAGTTLTLAERWNGLEWSILSTSDPAGPTEWSIAGVSCTAATACDGVDNDLLSGKHSIYGELLGPEWGAVGMPSPSGAQEVSASGLSCTSRTLCSAVGSYKDSTGAEIPLVERYF